MTDQQANMLGIDASMVLNSEAYQTAMTTLRESVIRKWRDCPIRDAEGQKLLLQMVKLADTFEEVLTGMVESGKFAHHRIQQGLDNARDESGVRRMMRRVL
jgi:hypothetical protein